MAISLGIYPTFSDKPIYGLIVCNLAIFGLTWLDHQEIGSFKFQQSQEPDRVCGKMVVWDVIKTNGARKNTTSRCKIIFLFPWKPSMTVSNMQNSLKIFKIHQDYICLHLNLAVSYVSPKSSFVLRWSRWTIEGILWWNSRKMLEMFHYFPSFFNAPRLLSLSEILHYLPQPKNVCWFSSSQNFMDMFIIFHQKNHKIWKFCASPCLWPMSVVRMIDKPKFRTSTTSLNQRRIDEWEAGVLEITWDSGGETKHWVSAIYIIYYIYNILYIYNIYTIYNIYYIYNILYIIYTIYNIYIIYTIYNIYIALNK